MSLDMSYCDGVGDCTSLVASLLEQPGSMMVSLSLQNCGISDRGAQELANALKTNSTGPHGSILRAYEL